MIQAMWTQFWGLGSVSWNGVISFNIMVLLRNPFMNTKSYVTMYHLYVWSITIATTLLLAFSEPLTGTKAYGVTVDGTCWISSSSPWWQLLFLGPLIFYFIISFACFLSACTRARMLSDAKNKTRMRVIRMLLFSVVFVSIWVSIHIFLKL